MIGYKVMRYENGKAVSGADSRQGFKVRVGYVIRMHGKGTFLSTNRQYVLDYYGGHNDREVLLKLEFDKGHITSGANTLNDREPELTVSQAKIVGFKIMDHEESRRPPTSVFTESRRAELRLFVEVATKPVPVGPMKKVMGRFKSAQDFANSKLSGYGAKSAAAIVHMIDTASKSRLNLSKVRQEVSEASNWYFLHKVKVSILKPGTHGKVEPSGKEDLSKPIVVGQRGEILDGRHRVVLAKQRGVRELPAYVPANVLYRMLTGKE